MAKGRKERFTSCLDFIAALRRQGVESKPRRRPPLKPVTTTTADVHSETLPFVEYAEEVGVVNPRLFQEAQQRTSQILGMPRVIEPAIGEPLVLIPRGRFVQCIGEKQSERTTACAPSPYTTVAGSPLGSTRRHHDRRPPARPGALAVSARRSRPTPPCIRSSLELRFFPRVGERQYPQLPWRTG